MAALSRVGDKNQMGGAIQTGAGSVVCNGKPVGVHQSSISPHAPWDKKRHPPHQSAKTTSGSPTVFAEGKPVLKVGSGNSCGHSIVEGSPNVQVP
jgi:uncharacterized Zn-binding protein involved in type VI secretion